MPEFNEGDPVLVSILGGIGAPSVCTGTIVKSYGDGRWHVNVDGITDFIFDSSSIRALTYPEQFATDQPPPRYGSKAGAAVQELLTACCHD